MSNKALKIMDVLNENITKTVTFSARCINTDTNSISVFVTEEDGLPVTKEINNLGLGNAVAQAMDVLTNRVIPLGTTIKVTIEVECNTDEDDFEIEELKEDEITQETEHIKTEDKLHVEIISDNVTTAVDYISLESRALTKARELGFSKKDVLVIDSSANWEDIHRLKKSDYRCLILDDAQLSTPGQQTLLSEIIEENGKTTIITFDTSRIKLSTNGLWRKFHK